MEQRYVHGRLLLLLRVADVGDEQLHLVRAYTFVCKRVHRFLVFAAIGDHIGQVGIRRFLRIIGDQTRDLRSRFTRQVCAMACGAFRLIEGSPIVSGPGQIREHEEQCQRDHYDQEHELRHLHDCNPFELYAFELPALKQENLAESVERLNENLLTVMQFRRNGALGQ
jgi:hypothetical protein